MPASQQADTLTGKLHMQHCFQEPSDVYLMWYIELQLASKSDRFMIILFKPDQSVLKNVRYTCNHAGITGIANVTNVKWYKTLEHQARAGHLYGQSAANQAVCPGPVQQQQSLGSNVLARRTCRMS